MVDMPGRGSVRDEGFRCDRIHPQRIISRRKIRNAISFFDMRVNIDPAGLT
jgi:hypothetical protein